MTDAILRLLGLWQPERPEGPCWWTWERLNDRTEAMWQHGDTNRLHIIPASLGEKLEGRENDDRAS